MRDKSYGNFDTNVREDLTIGQNEYVLLLGLAKIRDDAGLTKDQEKTVKDSFDTFFQGSLSPTLSVKNIVDRPKNNESFDYSGSSENTFGRIYNQLAALVKYDGVQEINGTTRQGVYRRKYDYVNFLANLAIYKRFPDIDFDNSGEDEKNKRKRQVIRPIANLLNMQRGLTGVNSAFENAIKNGYFAKADEALANQVVGIGILAAIVDWDPGDDVSYPLKLNLGIIADDDIRNKLLTKCEEVNADMQLLSEKNIKLPTDEELAGLFEVGADLTNQPSAVVEYIGQQRKKKKDNSNTPNRNGFKRFLQYRVQEGVNKIMNEVQSALPTDTTAQNPTEWRSQLLQDPNLAMLARELRLNHANSAGVPKSIPLPKETTGGLEKRFDEDDEPSDVSIPEATPTETEITPENYMVVLAAEKDFERRLDLAIGYRVARMKGLSIRTLDRAEIEAKVRECLQRGPSNEAIPDLIADYYNYIAYYAYIDAKNAEKDFSITDGSGNPISGNLSEHQVINANRVINATDGHGSPIDHQTGNLTICGGDLTDPKHNTLYKYGIGGMEPNPTAFRDEIERLTGLLEEDKEVIYIYGNHDAFFMHAMTVINDLTWDGENLQTDLLETQNKDDIAQILSWLRDNAGLETFEALGVEINKDQREMIKSGKVRPDQNDQLVALLWDIKQNQVGQKFYQALCKKGRFSVVVNGVLRQHTLPVVEVDDSAAYQIVGLPKPENLQNGSVLTDDKERISPIEFYEEARRILAGDDASLKKSLLTFLVKTDYNDSTNPGYSDQNELRTFSPLWHKHHPSEKKYGARRLNMENLLHRDILKDAKVVFDINKYLDTLNIAYATQIRGVVYGHVSKGGEIARDTPGGIFLVNIDNTKEKGMQFPFADLPGGIQAYYDHNRKKVRNVADGGEINVFNEAHYQIFLDRFMWGKVPDLTINATQDTATTPRVEVTVGDGLEDLYANVPEAQKDPHKNPYCIDGDIPLKGMELQNFVANVAGELVRANKNLAIEGNVRPHLIERQRGAIGANVETTPVVGMYDSHDHYAFNRTMSNDNDASVFAHIAAEMTDKSATRAALYERMMALTINEVKLQIDRTDATHNTLTVFEVNAGTTVIRLNAPDNVEAKIYLGNDLGQLFKDGTGKVDYSVKLTRSAIIAALDGDDDQEKFLFGKGLLKKIVEDLKLDDTTEYTIDDLMSLVLARNSPGGGIIPDITINGQYLDPFISLWEDRVKTLNDKLNDTGRTWSEEERRWVQFLAENFVDVGQVIAIVSGKDKVMALDYPGKDNEWKEVAEAHIKFAASTSSSSSATTPKPAPVPASVPATPTPVTAPAPPPPPTAVIPTGGNINILNNLGAAEIMRVANGFIRGRLKGPNILGRSIELRKAIAADKNESARKKLIEWILRPELNPRNINVLNNRVKGWDFPLSAGTATAANNIDLDGNIKGTFILRHIQGIPDGAGGFKFPGHVVDLQIDNGLNRQFVILETSATNSDIEANGLYSRRFTTPGVANSNKDQYALPIIQPDINVSDDEKTANIEQANARALETALLFMNADDEFIVVPRFRLDNTGNGLVLEVVTVDTRDMFASRMPLARQKEIDDKKIVDAYLERHTELIRGIEPGMEKAKQEVFINLADYLFEKAMVELLANPTFAAANTGATGGKEQILRQKLQEIKDQLAARFELGREHDILLKGDVEKAFALVQIMNIAARGGAYTNATGKDDAINTLTRLDKPNDLDLLDVYEGICGLYAEGDAFLIDIPGISENQGLLDLQRDLIVAVLRADGFKDKDLFERILAGDSELNLELFFTNELRQEALLASATATGTSAAKLTDSLAVGFKNKYEDLIRPDAAKLDRQIRDIIWEGRNLTDFNEDGFAGLDDIDRWATRVGGILKDKDTFASDGSTTPKADLYFEAIYPDTLANTAGSVAKSIESMFRKANPKDDDNTRMLRAKSWVENQISSGDFRAEVIRRLNIQPLNGNMIAVIQEFKDEGRRLDNSKQDTLLLQLTNPNHWENRYIGVLPLPTVQLGATDLIPAVTGELPYNHLGQAVSPQVTTTSTGFAVQVRPGVVVAVQTNPSSNANPTFSTDKKGNAYPYIDISALKTIASALRQAEIDRINAQFADLALNEMDVFDARGLRARRSTEPVFLPRLVIDGADVNLTFVLLNPAEEGFARLYQKDIESLQDDKAYKDAAARFRAVIVGDMVQKMLSSPSKSVLQIVTDYRTVTSGPNGLDKLDNAAKLITDQTTPGGLTITASDIRIRQLQKVLEEDDFILSGQLLDPGKIDGKTTPQEKKEELLRQLGNIRRVNAMLDAGVGTAGYGMLTQEKRAQKQATILEEVLPTIIALTLKDYQVNGKELNIEQKVILAEKLMEEGLAGMDRGLVAKVKLGLTDAVVYRKRHIGNTASIFIKNRTDQDSKGWGVGDLRIPIKPYYWYDKISPEEFEARKLTEKEQLERLYARDFTAELRAAFAGDTAMFDRATDLTAAVDKAITELKGKPFPTGDFLTDAEKREVVVRLLSGELLDYMPIVDDPEVAADELLPIIGEHGLVGKLKARGAIDDATFAKHVGVAAGKIARAVHDSDPDLDIDSIKDKVKTIAEAKKPTAKIGESSVIGSAHGILTTAADGIADTAALESPTVLDKIAEHGLRPSEVAKLRSVLVEARTKKLIDKAEAIRIKADREAKDRLKTAKKMLATHTEALKAKAAAEASKTYAEKKERESVIKSGELLARERIVDDEQGWLRRISPFRKTVPMSDYYERQVGKLNAERLEARKVFEEVIIKAAAAKLLQLPADGSGTTHKDLPEAGIFAADDDYTDPIKLKSLLSGVIADMPGFISPEEAAYVESLITPVSGRKRIDDAVVRAIVEKIKTPEQQQRIADLCFDGMFSTDGIDTRLGRLSQILANNFEEGFAKDFKGNLNRGAAGRIYELARAMGLDDDRARIVIQEWANGYKGDYSAAGNEEEMKFSEEAKNAINEYFAVGKLGTNDGYSPRSKVIDLGGTSFNKLKVGLKRDLNKLLPSDKRIFEADTATGRVFRSLLEDIANRTLENNDVKTYKNVFNRLGKVALEAGFVVALPGVGIALRWGAREAARTVLERTRRFIAEEKSGDERSFLTRMRDGVKDLSRGGLYIVPRTLLGISTFGLSEFYIAGSSFVWDVAIKNRKQLNRKDIYILGAAGISSLVASTGLSFVGAEAGKTIANGGPLTQAFGRFVGNQIGNFGAYSFFDFMNNRRKDNTDPAERRVRQELLYKSRTFAYMAFGPMGLVNATLNNPEFKDFVDGRSNPQNPVGKAIQDVNQAVFGELNIFQNNEPSRIVAEWHPARVGEMTGIAVNNGIQNIGAGLGNAWNEFGQHMNQNVFGPIGQGAGGAINNLGQGINNAFQGVGQGLGNALGGINLNLGGGGGNGNLQILPFPNLPNIQPNNPNAGNPLQFGPQQNPNIGQQPNQVIPPVNNAGNLFQQLFGGANQNNQQQAPFGINQPVVNANNIVVPPGASGEWVFVGESSDNKQLFFNTSTQGIVEAATSQQLIADPNIPQLQFAPDTFQPTAAGGDLLVQGIDYTPELRTALANGLTGDIDIVPGANGPRLVYAGSDNFMRVQQPIAGSAPIEIIPQDQAGNAVPLQSYASEVVKPGVVPLSAEAVVNEFVNTGAELDRDLDGIPDLLDPLNRQGNNITSITGAVVNQPALGVVQQPIQPGLGNQPMLPGVTSGFDIVHTQVQGSVDWTASRAANVESIINNPTLKSAFDQRFLAGDFSGMTYAQALAITGERSTALFGTNTLLNNQQSLDYVVNNIEQNGHNATMIPTFVSDINQAFANQGITNANNMVAAGAGNLQQIPQQPQQGLVQVVQQGNVVFLNNGQPITDPKLQNLINLAIGSGINPANNAEWRSFLDGLTPQEIDLIADGNGQVVLAGRNGGPNPILGGLINIPAVTGNALIARDGFGPFIVTNDPITGASSYNFGLFGASAQPNTNGKFDLMIGIPFIPGANIMLTDQANPEFVNNVLAKGGFLGLTAAGALLVGGGVIGGVRVVTNTFVRALGRLVGLGR